ARPCAAGGRSSPGQALAQPLLTTIARATPPERARCCRDTTTGAAWARLTVKTAAAVAGDSETSSARSSPLFALIPALMPAARKPRGVVTPPLTAEKASAITRAAPPPAGCRCARCERRSRAPPQLFDDHHADAGAARLPVDGQRPHLGDVRAERRELGAADDPPCANGDDEAVRVNGELAERPRQQMPFLPVCRDQRVQLLRFGGVGRPQRDVARRRRPRPWRFDHAAAPNAVRAASRRPSASSASASVMTSGGSSRTTVSAVRFTMTPRSRLAATTGAASRVRSTPHIRPAPRTSLTNACFEAIALSLVSKCRPTRFTCAISPRSTSSSRTHRAARQASRLPP